MGRAGSEIVSPGWNYIIHQAASLTKLKLSLEAEDASRIPEELCSHDVGCLKRSMEEHPSRRPHTSLVLAITRGPCQRPECWKENLDKLSMEARMQTFPEAHQLWRGPRPQRMAQAGWYCIAEDSAACPFCSVAVHDWGPHDDPWHRHHTWFPACPYLQTSPGRHTTAPDPEERRCLRHSVSSIYELCRSS